MKITYNTTIKKEEKNFKKYFEILLLVFTLTIISVILALSQLDSKIEEEKANKEDYVSVFEESKLHEILFSEEA